MKRVAIYIRVSTQEQAIGGYSIKGQQDKLTSYCELRDWIIDEIYIDGGFSGTNIDRPELKRLLNNLDNVDIVLVYKLDRLSRNQRDILYLVEEKFLNNNVDFVSIVENFDTSTPFGRAMMGILAVFAQLERETIIERTKLGKERRAKEGYWSGGPSPIGYDLNDGRLVINEYEAMLVKEVFKLYKKFGQNKTADIMNKKGYKTKYGRWYGKTISRIVQNPIYTGMINHKDTIYDGIHPAIISEEEFNKTQNLIKKRSRSKPSESKYLLGGVLWCGYCGARLKSTWSRSGKNKEKLYYYVCYSVSKHPSHMVKDNNCPGRFWRMDDLEKIVVNEIMKINLEKEKFILKYNELFFSTTDNGNQKEIIENKIIDIEKQIKRLIDLYQFDKIPSEILKERTESLYNEKKSLYKTLNELENNISQSIIPIEKLLFYFKRFPLIWNEASFDEKRVIVKSMIKRIVVKDDVKVEFNK